MRAVVVAVAAACLVAACGDGKAKPEAAPAKDKKSGLAASTSSRPPTTGTTMSGHAEPPPPTGTICDKGRAEKVGDIVGVRLRLTPAGGYVCSYANESEGANVVTVTRIPNGSAAITAQRESLPDAAPVEGIGDEAFFSPSARILWVRAGQDALMVQMWVPSDTQARAVSVARLFL